MKVGRHFIDVVIVDVGVGGCLYGSFSTQPAQLSYNSRHVIALLCLVLLCHSDQAYDDDVVLVVGLLLLYHIYMNMGNNNDKYVEEKKNTTKRKRNPFLFHRIRKEMNRYEIVRTDKTIQWALFVKQFRMTQQLLPPPPPPSPQSPQYNAIEIG